MRRRLATSLALTLLPAQALASAFSLGAEVGGTARHFESLALDDPYGFGLEVGLRTELNLLVHLKADARFMEGTTFSADEHRFAELSFSGSSPALLVFALDVHELYARKSSRPGDDLLYLHTGLGIKAKFAGSKIKGSLGFSLLQGDDALDYEAQALAMGLYGGVEYMLRSKWIDTSLRAAVYVAFQEGQPYTGLLADGDLMVKFPVGKAALGPRLDVAYRHLGLDRNAGDLFGQRQEISAHAGIAFHWGVGGR